MKEFYNLSFEDIKDDIKNFMQTTESFSDYNFEGSAASQIIDVLAYATQHSAFYLSQSLNEFFMHTVQMENNVYKLSHQLNYLPNRKSAPYLVVDFQRSSEVTILIPKFTKFAMGEIFLTNVEDIIIDNNDVQEITLYEGEETTEYFISDGDTEQIYELAYRENIDNDYFYVYVDTPDGIGGYILGTEPWINLNKESFDTFENAYYVRYFEKFSIAFDNGNLFNVPVLDDRIRIIYLKTNGILNNGLTGDISLSTPEDIVNSEYLTITNNDTTKNGADEETVEAIKTRAPLFYVTQNRAVTEKDHNIIAKRYSRYNIFEDVILWGGEKETIDSNGDFDETANLKDLGHVYLTALKATNLDFLTTEEIENYIIFLNKQKFISIFFKFIHSNRIILKPTINISFKSVLNVNTDDVQIQINEYLDSKQGFDKTFYLSELIAYVNSIDVVEYNTVTFTTAAIVKSENPKIIRAGGEIVSGSIDGTIDGHSLTDSGGILYHNGSSCGSITYNTGWINITKTFTDTEYEVIFEYAEKEKIALERENFLYYNDIILNSL